ncbi:PCDGH protein, partial [Copsychus sechellarum]|nr:PCDGH protein [Copsychus sechellarum]
QYFTVNEENGNLYVNERLDREEMCGESPTCSVSFEVLVHNPLNIFRVEVDIQDMNDNSPAFSKAVFDLEIGEWTLPGARFPLETARDADVGSNSLLTYQLDSNPSFSLALKESPDGSKQPELVLERMLDREKQSSLELVLTAVDSGDPARSGTVQLRINVTDANDNPPVFSKSLYEARVTENLPVGSLVLQVRATDADAGTNGRLSYSFSNVPAAISSLFAVDSESGEISTAGALDFEQKSKYIFGLEARDGGGLVSHCKVQIDITDENDNSPKITILSLSGAVPEDAPVGTVVALLNVNDPDSGENGQVWCELSGEAPLSISEDGSKSAELVLRHSLDRESEPSLRLLLTAVDGGDPPRTGTAQLWINVTDANDNPPVFEQDRYRVSLREDAAPGSTVLNVSASDADAGTNARITYGFGKMPAKLLQKFAVDAQRGTIRLKEALDFEDTRAFSLALEATDGGGLVAHCKVEVEVLDVNDNPPEI